MASEETQATLLAGLLNGAREQLQALALEARQRGPGWGFLVTEADQVDVTGAPADVIEKHAKLGPGDSWVELLPMRKILAGFGDEDGGVAYAGIVASIRQMTSTVTLPKGATWIIAAISGTVLAFPAEITSTSVTMMG